MLLWSVLRGILWKTSLELVICESNLFEMLVFYWFHLLDECNLLVDKQHAKVVIPFSMYTEHQCCWHSWQYRADCMPGGNTWRPREGKCSSMQSPPGWIIMSIYSHTHTPRCLFLFIISTPHWDRSSVAWNVKSILKSEVSTTKNRQKRIASRYDSCLLSTYLHVVIDLFHGRAHLQHIMVITFRKLYDISAV